MADIDKALPNVEQEIKLPSEEEIAEASQENIEEQVGPEDVQVEQDEDGGATITFDPEAINQPGTNEHFDNLADLLPEDVLGSLGSELYENYMQYKASRKDWEDAYTKGLDLLGFKYENRTQPFTNASGATHPVLAEAVTQFQAHAYKELLPANGPVHTQIMGVINRQKEDQATRVKNFMNYQLMNVMKEYEPEFDQLLFYLPLSGSAFKKVYYDELLDRAVSKFVPADDLIVPYTATSLEDADSIVHVLKMSENELRKKQVSGFYRDIEITPGYSQETEVEKKERELEGVRKTRDEQMFTILEFHTNLDLEGFEDKDMEQNPTGIMPVNAIDLVGDALYLPVINDIKFEFILASTNSFSAPLGGTINIGGKAISDRVQDNRTMQTISQATGSTKLTNKIIIYTYGHSVPSNIASN